MRRLTYFLLLIPAWGQLAPPSQAAIDVAPPEIRDAYVIDHGDLERTARLKDNLKVVICKSDFDAWEQAHKPAPALLLYMDGRLMEGVAPHRPELQKESPNDPAKDSITKKVNDTCESLALDAVTALEKAAADKAALAEDAKDKAVGEAAADQKKEAKDKDDAANAAALELANAKAAAARAGKARYVLTYYLDAQFVAKEKTREPWLRLLERPWAARPVTVSVGTDGKDPGLPWPSEVTVAIERINLGWLAAWAILFGVSIVYFVQYARDSDIIRDPGPLLPVTPEGVTPKKAYSLARTQMALWTFLVAGALAFIFTVTWNENTLTNGILVLIGISFSTTLLAATTDSTTDAAAAADKLKAEKDAADKAAALAAAQKEVDDNTAAASAARKEADEKAAAATAAAQNAAAATDAEKVQAEQAASAAAGSAKVAADRAEALSAAAAAATVKAAAAKSAEHSALAAKSRETQGFLTDLLTEGSGPSFHRFQMVLFTSILAVIFVVKAANALIMPEFDGTLLGLMGISSGTYLGFKLQGK